MNDKCAKDEILVGFLRVTLRSAMPEALHGEDVCLGISIADDERREFIKLFSQPREGEDDTADRKLYVVTFDPQKPSFQFRTRLFVLGQLFFLEDDDFLGDHPTLVVRVSCLVTFDEDPFSTSINRAVGTIVSGSVTIAANEPFNDSGPVSPKGTSEDASDIFRRFWPADQPAIVGFQFGPSSLQMEVIQPAAGNPQRRERLELAASAARGQTRVWKAVPCAGSKRVEDPDTFRIELLKDLVGGLRSQPFPMGLHEQQEETGQEAGLFYVVIKESDKYRTYQFLRSGLRLLFKGDTGSTMWTPATLLVQDKGDGGARRREYTFIDFDLIERIDTLSGTIPLLAEQNAVCLRWKRVTGSPAVATTAHNLPDLHCIRSEPAGLAKNTYVWHWSRISPSDAPRDSGGAWLRYHWDETALSERTREQPDRRAETLTGPPFCLGDLGPAQWKVLVDVPKAKADVSTPSVQCIIEVKQGKVNSVELRFRECHIAAHTPILNVYRPALSDPSSVPNTKMAPQTLAAASLVFVGRYPAQDRDKNLERSLLQATFIESDDRPDFLIKAARNLAVAYLPYDQALIDPVSPTRGNLVAEKDPDSGRAVIPRDVNHGLVPRSLSSFTFARDAGKRPTRVVFEPGQVVEGAVDSVMALAPWIQWQHKREGGGPLKRHLHHRNLVLEHGEFAAASVERSTGQDVLALPATAEDFVAAVRDSYTPAAYDVKTEQEIRAQDAGAPEDVVTTNGSRVVNWLPGALLVAREKEAPGAPGGDDDRYVTWPDRVLLDIPESGTGEDRLPRVKLSRLPHQAQHPELKLNYVKPKPIGTGTSPDKRWLDFDLRWDPRSRTSAQPTFVLNDPKLPPTPEDATGGDAFRVTNSSAPLLFDLVPVAAVDAAFIDGKIRVAALGIDGLIRLWDPLRQELLPNGVSPGPTAFSRDPGSAESVILRQSADGTTVAAANKSGLLQIWRYSDSGTWDRIHEHAGTLLRSSSIQALDNMLYFLTVGISGTVALKRWDPLSPMTLEDIQFPGGASVASACCLVDNGRLVVAAVAPGGTAQAWEFLGAPGVYKAMGETQQAVNESKSVALGRWKDQWFLAVVSKTREIKVFALTGDTFRPWDNPCDESEPKEIPREAVITRILLSTWSEEVQILTTWTDGIWRRWRTFAPQDAPTLTNAGFSPKPPREPLLDYPGHDGRIGAVSSLTAPVSPSARPVPCVLTGGTDGTTRLWDGPAGYERGCCKNADRWYDNLGVIRSAVWQKPAGPWIVEGITFPDPVDAPRDPSAYVPVGTVVSVSFARDANTPSGTPEPPLVDEPGTEGPTHICFSCEGLKLKKSGAGLWEPLTLASSANDEHHKRDPHNLHWGFRGVYGLFSATDNGLHNPSHWPVLAGIPIHPVRLNWITFAPDFTSLEGMSFEAVLLNPLDTPTPKAGEEFPSSVKEAVARGATIEITIGLSGGRLTVLSVSGNVSWHFSPAAQRRSDFPHVGFDGKLTRVQGKVSYEGGRLVVDVSPADCEANVFGRSWHLGSVKLRLASWSDSESFGFASEDVPQTPWESEQPTGSFAASAAVTALAASDPTRDFLVLSGGKDKQAVLRDAATGVATPPLAVNGEIVGLDLVHLHVPHVVGISGREIRIWDSETGQSILSLAHDAEITDVVCGLHDGEALLLAGSADGIVKLWSAETGRLILELAAHAAAVTSVSMVSYSRDDTLQLEILTAGADGHIRLWNGETGLWMKDVILQGSAGEEPIRSNVKAAMYSAVHGFAILAAGTVVFGGSELTGVWAGAKELTTLARRRTVAGSITAVTFGTYLSTPCVAVVSEGEATLWTLATLGQDGHDFRTKPTGSAVTTVACLDDGGDGEPLVLTGGIDSKARIWNAKQSGADPLYVIDPGSIPGNPRMTVGFSRFAGKWCVATSAWADPGSRIAAPAGSALPDRVRLWDVQGGAEIPDLEWPGDPKQARRGIKQLASIMVPVLHAITGEATGMVRLWDMRRRAERRNFSHPSLRSVKAAGADDKVRIVTAGADSVKVWDPEKSSEPQWNIDTGRPVIAMDALGMKVAGSFYVWFVVGLSGDEKQAVVYVSVDGGQPKAVYEFGSHVNGISSVALRKPKDAEFLEVLTAGQGQDQKVALWRLAGAQSPDKPTLEIAHQSAVSSVALAYVDGKRHLVTACGDGKVRLWCAPDKGGSIPVPSGPRWVFSGHKAGALVVRSVETEDGLCIFSGDSAGVLRHWEVEPYLRIFSVPEKGLSFHLPVDLAKPVVDAAPALAAGVAPLRWRLNAAITPGKRLRLFLETESSFGPGGGPAGTPERTRVQAFPAIFQSMYYGFVLEPTSSPDLRGRGALVLWIEGPLSAYRVSGIWVKETFDAESVMQLKGKGSTFSLTGPRLRLSSALGDFSGSTAPNSFMTVTTWLLDVKKPSGPAMPTFTLRFLISEQDQGSASTVWPGGVSSASRLIAHFWYDDLSKKFPEIQGPLMLSYDESTATLEVEPLAYLIQPVHVPETADVTQNDISFPKGTPGTVQSFDVRTAGDSGRDHSAFVVPSVVKKGMQFSVLKDSSVPMNLCLERDAVRPFPVVPIRCPQLIHREVLGPRLRLSPPQGFKPLNVNGSPSDTVWPTGQSGPNPEKSKWIVGLVGSDSRRMRLFEQKLWVREASSGGPDKQQTENLLVFQRPPSQKESFMACIFSATANMGTTDSQEFYLNDKAIKDQVLKVGASGVVVHRVFKGVGPSELRFVKSPFFGHDAVPDTSEALGSESSEGMERLHGASEEEPLPDLDFRLLSPLRAMSWSLVRDGRYVPRGPDPVPVPAEDTVVYRRVKFIHHTAPGSIESFPGQNVRYSYQVLESVAFERMEPTWFVPRHRDPLVTANQEDPAISATFQPRSMEFRYAPDKPGALFHHKLHAGMQRVSLPVIVAEQSDHGVSAVLPDPRGCYEPITEFALRDPQQFNAPRGARIDFDDEVGEGGEMPVSRDDNLGVEQYHLKWKERLGEIEVRADLGAQVTIPPWESTVPLDQIKEDLVLEMEETPLQLVVQINEKLVDIDEKQPQLPIYFKKVQAEHESLHVPDPLCTHGNQEELEALDSVIAYGRRRVITAGGNQPVKMWTVGGPDVPTTFTAEGNQLKGRVVAFAQLDGMACAMIPVGNTVHLFDVMSPEHALEKLIPAGALDEIVSVAHAVVTVAQPAPASPKDYECYLAADGAGKGVLWYKERDEDAVDQFALPSTTGPAAWKLLAVAASGPSGHTRSERLIAFEWADVSSGRPRYRVHEIDIPGKTVSSLAEVSVKELKAADIAWIDGRLLVATGDAYGSLVLSEVPLGPAPAPAPTAKVTEFRSFAHGAPISALTFVPNEFKPLVAVGTSTGTVHVWDPISGNLLRDARDQEGPLLLARAESGGAPFLLSGDDVSQVRLWDLNMTSFRSPRMFLISKKKDLFTVPAIAEIKLPVGAPVSVSLLPYLVLERNSDAATPAVFRLSEVFPAQPMTVGPYHLWEFSHESLPWHDARSFSIQWIGTIPRDGLHPPQVASIVFGPLGKKGIKLVPHSAVVPKMAAVLIVDQSGGAPPVARPVLRRTILFGDSAAANKGTGTIEHRGGSLYLFAFETRDEERVWVGVPSPVGGTQFTRQLFLVKYLINGETLATAKL